MSRLLSALALGILFCGQAHGSPDGQECVGLEPYPNPHSSAEDDLYRRHQACLSYMAQAKQLVGVFENDPNMRRPNPTEFGEVGSVDRQMFSQIFDKVFSGDSAEVIQRSLFCDCLTRPVEAFWDKQAGMGSVPIDGDPADPGEASFAGCTEKTQLLSEAFGAHLGNASKTELVSILRPLGDSEADELVTMLNRSVDEYVEHMDRVNASCMSADQY